MKSIGLFQKKAIENEPGAKKRAPLDVINNGAGTYTMDDGNATAQAAMLAGWSKLPVRVVDRRLYSGSGTFDINQAQRDEYVQKYGPAAQIFIHAIQDRALDDGAGVWSNWTRNFQANDRRGSERGIFEAQARETLGQNPTAAELEIPRIRIDCCRDCVHILLCEETDCIRLV